MVNSIKKGGDRDVRLQITKPARASGLVHEDANGDPTELADVQVYSFDNLLFVIDQRISMATRADLVAKLASYTDSIHDGQSGTVSIAGDGYQINLPAARKAGFHIGDPAPIVTADGTLLIHTDETYRIAQDVATIRDESMGQQSL